MSYRIAVASTDGEYIDLNFGAALSFDIYEVNGSKYHLFEKRTYCLAEEEACDSGHPKDSEEERTEYVGCHKGGCSNGGCGTSVSSTGGGCSGSGDGLSKVNLISDCRCVVCKKIGFHITKQLEKRAIVGFDVDCRITEALDKITRYFDKVDSHQSLRGMAKESEK